MSKLSSSTRWNCGLKRSLCCIIKTEKGVGKTSPEIQIENLGLSANIEYQDFTLLLNLNFPQTLLSVCYFIYI